mgnify:FL=1
MAWVAWVAWVAWECNTIPVQNTLRTRVKQIRNPQKEISGGFFIPLESIHLLKINLEYIFFFSSLTFFILINKDLVFLNLSKI